MPEVIFHRLKSITPLPDFTLKAEFLDGSEKIYDVKPLIKKFPFLGCSDMFTDFLSR